MSARLFITFVLCFGVTFLHAQQSTPQENSKPVYWQIFGAYSMPIGSFADESEGGAQSGWGLGVQEFRGVGARNLFLSFSLSYTSQPYKFTDLLSWNGGDIEGNYSIVNLLIGFGARTKQNPVNVYINFMGGFTYASIGGELANYGNDDALTFGISPGAGIIIAKNFNVGLKYYYANPTFRNYGNIQQKISMLHFIAGIEF